LGAQPLLPVSPLVVRHYGWRAREAADRWGTSNGPAGGAAAGRRRAPALGVMWWQRCRWRTPTRHGAEHSRSRPLPALETRVPSLGRPAFRPAHMSVGRPQLGPANDCASSRSSRIARRDGLPRHPHRSPGRIKSLLRCLNRAAFRHAPARRRIRRPAGPPKPTCVPQRSTTPYQVAAARGPRFCFCVNSQATAWSGHLQWPALLSRRPVQSDDDCDAGAP
jgi:hypothetical protein